MTPTAEKVQLWREVVAQARVMEALVAKMCGADPPSKRDHLFSGLGDPGATVEEFLEDPMADEDLKDFLREHAGRSK